MFTRFSVTVLALLASIALSGCFIVDEIDKGMDIMDQHSAKNAEAPASEPAAVVDGGESTLPAMAQKISKWWNDALIEEPVPHDPSDGIVRCTVKGTASFTRKSDCEIRGGRVGS